MADFVSHHLFGRQALTVFPAPAQRAAACRPACFFWGCQGPDPLFYRKIRRTDKVTESTYAAQPVTRWSPTSAAARDYRAWVEDLMEVQ